MTFLLWLAAALFVAWLVFAVIVEVAGFAIHLLLFAAALAIIAWGVRKVMGRPQRTTTGP